MMLYSIIPQLFVVFKMTLSFYLIVCGGLDQKINKTEFFMHSFDPTPHPYYQKHCLYFIEFYALTIVFNQQIDLYLSNPDPEIKYN